MNQSSPLTLQDATHRDSAWERASGDIVIRANQPVHDHSVAGSGDIKFKK
ncbi:MAG: hypothetical protein ACRES5_14265 [Pseudomonas sp.]